MTAICVVSGLDGLARVEIDLELIDKRYQITRLEAWPTEGQSLDLYSVQHRLNVSAGIRRAVMSEVQYDALDGDTYTRMAPMSDPDPLHRVALAYTIAVAFGEKPNKVIAEHMGISPNAAAQRVKRCRDADPPFLPPTEAGKVSS